MGSVITYDMECPECKQETGFHDFYYKNDEEYFFCENDDCRFSYKYEWKRDEDNKLVTVDGTDNCKFDNLIMLETVVKDGVETVTELNHIDEDKEEIDYKKEYNRIYQEVAKMLVDNRRNYKTPMTPFELLSKWDKIREVKNLTLTELLCECTTKILPNGNIQLTLCKKCAKEW